MSSIQQIELRPGYSISRVLKGGWHLAGGHGAIDARQAIDDMRAFIEAGITTFDCADIYTGVEELIGRFLREYREALASGALSSVQVHTKYVPDYDALPTLQKQDTERIIDRSLRRLGLERLDLVQFHWWDFSIPGYVEAALHLADLQQAGKIRYVGVTNFDAVHLKELLDAGVPVVSNQVQYSVLDRRPAAELTRLAEIHDISLLCYGAIAGGFLSDRYLDAPEPVGPLENRSLVKYRLIIAEVVARYVLQQPHVAGVIVGARNRKHLAGLQALCRFQLDAEDLAVIAAMQARAAGPAGPVYALERDKNGKHGAIMRYNLSEQNK